MALPRSSALRSTFRCPSYGPRSRPLRSQPWRQDRRRGYSSEGAGPGGRNAKQSKTDPIWAAASIAVTVPGTYFIYKSGPTGNPFRHPLPGENYHGEEDGEGHEDGEEGGEGEEPASEGEGDSDTSSDDESGDQSTDDGSDAPNKSPGEPAEEPSEGENAAQEEESQGQEEKTGAPNRGGKGIGKRVAEAPADGRVKAANAAGESGLPWDQPHELEKGAKGETRLHLPDSKGGMKRRIESPKGIVQGRAQGAEEGPSIGDVKDGSKSAVAGQVNKQQKGISNTDTKHSTDLMADPEKSKKGEGVPETAKIQGTVRPDRKQV